MRDEERIEGAEEPPDVVRLAGCERVRHGCAQVRVVGREPRRGRALAAVCRSRGARLGRARRRRRAAAAAATSTSRGLELLRGVLADRLEHPVAPVREAEQALLDERLQGVEVGVADLPRPPPACSRPRRRERRRKSCLLLARRAGRTTTRSSPAASAGAGRRRGRPRSRSRRCESRSRICAGVSAFVRAAASSTASGQLVEAAAELGDLVASARAAPARRRAPRPRDSASGGTGVLDLALDAQELAAA